MVLFNPNTCKFAFAYLAYLAYQCLSTYPGFCEKKTLS